MATPKSKFAYHMWACDTEGGVHVLTHVTSSESKWRLVSGEMGKVMCRRPNDLKPILICGIKDQLLFIRTGVSSSAPLGLKWSSTGIQAVDLAMGDQYIMIKGPSNELFVKDISEIDVSSAVELLPIAKLIEIEKKSFLSDFVFDADDNLYGFSPKGDLYFCRNMPDLDQLSEWQKVKSHPVEYNMTSIVNRMSSIFSRKDSSAMFSSVSAGKGCFWCLRTDPPTLWQLVFNSKLENTKDMWKKSSWNKFTFKEIDPPLAICGDPHSCRELFGITSKQDTLVRLTLNSSEVKAEELPFHGCGDIALSSLSLSFTERMIISKMYPKLNDSCCEDGTCDYCQKEPAAILNDKEELRRYLKRGREGRSSSKKRKMSSPTTSSVGHIAGKKRKSTVRLDEDEEEQFYTCQNFFPLAKRAKSNLPKQGLIEGIPVQLAIAPVLERAAKFEPVKMTPSFVEHKFKFSFKVEESVLNP